MKSKLLPRGTQMDSRQPIEHNVWLNWHWLCQRPQSKSEVKSLSKRAATSFCAPSLPKNWKFCYRTCLSAFCSCTYDKGYKQRIMRERWIPRQKLSCPMDDDLPSLSSTHDYAVQNLMLHPRIEKRKVSLVRNSIYLSPLFNPIPMVHCWTKAIT